MGPMSPPAAAADGHPPRSHALIVLAAVAMGFAAVLLARGAGGAWGDRVVVFAGTLLRAGWAPCLYLLSALGYGRVVRRWVPSAGGRWVIELGAGLTLLLSLTHLVGVLGLLGVLSAWLVTGVGLVLVLVRGGAGGLRPAPVGGLTVMQLAIVCGGVLALVMACNPPGVLWGSEYGGFDALSYHLQLAREWVESGRVWPSEHSVYSFLPGYVEASYAHMALMMGGGMHSDDGRALISAQLLSALMLLCSAGMIGVLARVACERVLPGCDGVLAGRLGAALTLGTPWLLVVGTLAYNEIAVVLLGASALCVAMTDEMRAWRRGVLCGLIVGGACCCKPTALFLLAPSVGIVLLSRCPRRAWAVAALGCVVVGGLTIGPWLIRNALATGNPVFPQMSGVFGLGHWDEAQHAVWASAHGFDGSLLDRLALLVVPDAGGTTHVSRFRGVTNGQWALTPLLGVIGLAGLLVRGRTLRAGLVGVLALAVPVMAWALLTHVQSRFLVPLAPVLIVLGVLGVVSIGNAPLLEAAGKIVGIGAVMCSLLLALLQNGGSPFLWFDLGPGAQMGGVEGEVMPWTAVAGRLGAGGEGAVYLLGDATPIYVTGDVRYNTVYDDWLIGEAMATSPGDPGAWSAYLRERGIGFVVIGFSEIDRYARSGWLPGSVDPGALMVWIETLGEPIEVWSGPDGSVQRAVFRVAGPGEAP